MNVTRYSPKSQNIQKAFEVCRLAISNETQTDGLMNEFKCGCKTNGFMIEYCPKHRAASDMYEALKAIEKWEKIKDGEIQKMIKRSLSKAEGKG